MNRDFSTLLVIGALACVLGALPAVAQNTIGNGRKIDNSLQNGSGGANPAQVQPDYQSRNDVITGNVPGLGYFHGTVGYRSPNSFQTALPSGQLDRFRADALSQTFLPPGYGASGAYGGVSLPPGQAPVSVFGSFSNAGGDPRFGGAANALNQQVPGWALRVQPYGLTSPVQQGLQPGMPPGMQTLGFLTQPGGQTYELSASPLLGLRRRDVIGEMLTDQVPTSQPAGADVEPSRIDGALDPARTTVNPARSVKNPSKEQNPAPAINVPLGDELGLELRAKLQPETTGMTPAAVDQRAKHLDAVLFRSLATTGAKAGEEVYTDILAAIVDQARTAPGTAKAGKTDLTPLPAPTKEKLEAAEAARARAARQARGLSVQQPAKPGDEGDAENAALAGSLDELLKTLKSTPAPVGSLAGRRENRVNALLRLAEEDLAAGRYFNAESQYHQILDRSPDHPLARVGLVHAQLGAGLIRSAAGNLRRLFEDHPELIAVRYQANLLPAAQRLAWVRQELDTMVANTTTRTEPALLLAYLGYQTDSPDLTRYGLDLAQARQPADPLIPLLRRLWLAKPAGK